MNILLTLFPNPCCRVEWKAVRNQYDLRGECDLDIQQIGRSSKLHFFLLGTLFLNTPSNHMIQRFQVVLVFFLIDTWSSLHLFLFKFSSTLPRAMPHPGMMIQRVSANDCISIKGSILFWAAMPLLSASNVDRHCCGLEHPRSSSTPF